MAAIPNLRNYAKKQGLLKEAPVSASGGAPDLHAYVKQQQHDKALATERADEADKSNASSTSRQKKAAAQASQAYTPVSRAVEESNARILYNVSKNKVQQDRKSANDIYSNDPAVRAAETTRRETNEKALQTAADNMRRLGLGAEVDPTPTERLVSILTGATKLYGAQAVGVAEWMENVAQAYRAANLANYQRVTERAWAAPTLQQTRAQVQTLQNLGSRLKESGSRDVERAQQGLGTLGETAVNVGVAGLQMAGDVALGAATGGGAMLPMVVRSFGGGVQEAREKGYSAAQQTALGLASAATEYFTERLFGGNPAYDTDVGLVNRLVERVSKNPRLVAALSSLPADVVSEGLEEIVSDILNPIAEKVITGNWTGYDVDQIIQDGVVGMALGALGQGGQYIRNTTRGTGAPTQTGNSRPFWTATPSVDGRAGNFAPANSEAVTGQKTGNPAMDPLVRAVVETQRTAATAQEPVQAVQKPVQEPVQAVQKPVQEPVQATQIVQEPMQNVSDLDTRAARQNAQSFDPAQHIDNRDMDSVKTRKINAFQFDHPELRPFYTSAAEALAADAGISLEAPMDRYRVRGMEGRKYRQAVATSPQLRSAMDDAKLTRTQIIDAAQRIVNDQGQENVYAAKQVELILDNMLTNGYTTLYGQTVGPNEEYIRAKQTIEGAKIGPEKGSFEEYKNRNKLALELGEVTEDELRAEWEAQQEENDAGDTVMEESEENTLPKGTGAAESGFDPFSHAELLYGVQEGGMNAVRPDDAPISTNGKDRVSRSVVSAKGAEMTPDAFVPRIEEETMKGRFSYMPITNNETALRAQSYIMQRGWERALRDWLANVNAGKSSPVIVATGATLYNNAVNSGQYELALDILTNYQKSVRNTAQALEVTRLLKTMRPEDRLYMIQAQLSKYNEDQQKKTPKKRKRNVTEADNVPVEDWMKLVGEELADHLEQQGKVPKKKAKTVSQTIFEDLKRFYRQDVPLPMRPKNANARTDFDRLHDMFANRENYQKAWDSAREKLKSDLGEDSAALAAFEMWLDRAPDYADRLTRMMVDKETLSSAPQIRISEAAAEQYLTAETEEERDAAISRMQQEVADQLPSTLIDKWTALRYLNMLGNFKTQGRNLAGNAGMRVLSEARYDLAASLESLAQAASKGKYEKRRAVFVDKALRRAAKADFEIVRDAALGDSRYSVNEGRNDASDFMRGAMEKRKIFKRRDGTQGIGFRALEAYRTATQWAMEEGDVLFSRSSYARALSGYLKAHNVSAEQFNDADWRKQNETLLDKARAMAIQEAQEATFRDNNAISSWVSKIGRRPDTPPLAKMAVEGLAPFRKTPANVAVRAVEYSPLGLLSTAYNAVQTARGNVTDVDLINQLSKNLVGTGLFALGLALRSMGIVRGDDDDEDQKYFDELQGQQPYSAIFDTPWGETLSYTLDWLSPESIPFFMGAALYDEMKDGDLSFEDIESALTRIAEPMLEMSMLSGINDTLNSLKYSKDNLGQLVGSLAMSYATQGLTNTLLGQVERTAEENRMSTYVEHDSPLPSWVQKTLGKASAKVPGWDFQQYEYIDAWGRTESNGDPLVRAVTNFASPGYLSEISTSAREEELQRLADYFDNRAIFPDIAEKSFSVNGETKYLNMEEYQKYARKKGQESARLLDAIMDSSEYKSMSEDDKLDAVTKAFEYANAVAKQEVSDYKPGDSSWLSKAIGNRLPPEKYIPAYIRYGSAKYLPGGDQYEKLQEIEKAGMSFEDWMDYRDKAGDLTADKDADGKTISGSKKEKVVALIDGLNVSSEAKDILYRDANYSEKDLQDMPWHN